MPRLGLEKFSNCGTSQIDSTLSKLAFEHCDDVSFIMIAVNDCYELHL